MIDQMPADTALVESWGMYEMKRERVVHLINVLIGACLLVYGSWTIYWAVDAFKSYFGPYGNGAFARDIYSAFVSILLLADHLLSLMFGILRIVPFVRRTSGKYICVVAGINLLCVFAMEVCCYIALGVTMIQRNPKRLILPVVLLLIGILWQHFYKDTEKQISAWFPFVGEFAKLIKK